MPGLGHHCHWRRTWGSRRGRSPCFQRAGHQRLEGAGRARRTCAADPRFDTPGRRSSAPRQKGCGGRFRPPSRTWRRRAAGCGDRETYHLLYYASKSASRVAGGPMYRDSARLPSPPLTTTRYTFHTFLPVMVAISPLEAWESHPDQALIITNCTACVRTAIRQRSHPKPMWLHSRPTSQSPVLTQVSPS